MAMGMAKQITTSEPLPKGYTLVESEFGGIYFEAGNYASEDYRSRRQAAIAARAHRRQEAAAGDVEA